MSINEMWYADIMLGSGLSYTVLCNCIAEGTDNLHPPWRCWNTKKLRTSKYYIFFRTNAVL